MSQITVVTSQRLTFVVDTSATAVGAGYTICIASSSIDTLVVVGTVGSVQIVTSTAVTPLGLPAPVQAGQAITVLGNSLSVLDVVKLVALDASGTVTCANTAGSAEIFTQSPQVTASSLQVQLVTNIDSGAQYLVCIQYRSQGLFYPMASAADSIFSAVSTTSVQPLQYNFVVSQALTVAGGGLSARDIYFAVPVTSVDCLAANIAAVSFSTPFVVNFGSRIMVTASISDSTGRSFLLCVRPGGNAASPVLVASGASLSAAQAVSFSPTAMPLVSSVVLTISGSGFPVGSNTVLVKVLFSSVSHLR